MLARRWTIIAIRKYCRRINSIKIEYVSRFFRSLIIYNIPLFSQTLWIFSLFSYEPPTYDNGDYKYPAWAHWIGWSFTAASLGCIPIFAVIAIIRGDGNTLFKVSVILINRNSITLRQIFFFSLDRFFMHFFSLSFSLTKP